jgi:hypothetical protein
MVQLAPQSKSDMDYATRVFRFMKRNVYMYLPDFGLLLMLLLPPYTWLQFWIALVGLLILSIRDIVLLILAKYHVYHVEIQGKEVVIKLVRFSRHFQTFRIPIHDLTITSTEKMGCTIMSFKEGRFLLHRQYPIGRWSPEAIEQFKTRLQEQKKELLLHTIFRGAMSN